MKHKKEKSFEELPGRLQRKILKKREKWATQKRQKSDVLDFNKTDEKILESYKESFPDTDEAKLLQNIKY